MSGTTKGPTTTKAPSSPPGITTKNSTPPAPAVTPTTMAAPDQTVTIVGQSPGSLDPPDGLIQNLAPLAAGDQPVFPTVWPPSPLPTVSLPAAGMIPWRQWVNNMAVRPHPTDPAPGPVVVSRYPGLTVN